MFLRRSLARAYNVHHVIWFFSFWYIWGLAPPPHTKKLATLLLPKLIAHQKSGQMKMADSVPPPPPPLVGIAHWKLKIIWHYGKLPMEVYYLDEWIAQLHCMSLVSYIQQYFNTSITVLTNQVWKLLIALFKLKCRILVLLWYIINLDTFSHGSLFKVHSCRPTYMRFYKESIHSSTNAQMLHEISPAELWFLTLEEEKIWKF